MKIRYSYKEYHGHPEATEISKNRGCAFTFYCIALAWGILISLATLIENFSTSWYIAIPVIVLCMAGYAYLITRYNDVTERKIAKVIAEKNKIEQKKIAEKYICLSILALDSYKSGCCEKCLASSSHLRECIVQDQEGERFTFICNSCIAKYNKNKR